MTLLPAPGVRATIQNFDGDPTHPLNGITGTFIEPNLPDARYDWPTIDDIHDPDPNLSQWELPFMPDTIPDHIRDYFRPLLHQDQDNRTFIILFQPECTIQRESTHDRWLRHDLDATT